MTRHMIYRLSSLLVVVAISVGITAACTSDTSTGESPTLEGLPEEFSRLEEVWELVVEERVHLVPDELLQGRDQVVH